MGDEGRLNRSAHRPAPYRLEKPDGYGMVMLFDEGLGQYATKGRAQFGRIGNRLLFLETTANVEAAWIPQDDADTSKQVER